MCKTFTVQGYCSLCGGAYGFMHDKKGNSVAFDRCSCPSDTWMIHYESDRYYEDAFVERMKDIEREFAISLF